MTLTGTHCGRQFPDPRLETQQLLAELKITLGTSNPFQLVLCPEGQEGKDLSPFRRRGWGAQRGRSLRLLCEFCPASALLLGTGLMMDFYPDPRTFPSRPCPLFRMRRTLSAPEMMTYGLIFCPGIWAEIVVKYPFNFIVLRVHSRI